MTSNITIDSTDAIILELFKYINNVRQLNNMNLFSHDYLSEYILSNLFRLKKGPPSNNEIDAKFVSQGCVLLDNLIFVAYKSASLLSIPIHKTLQLFFILYLT